MSDMYHPWRHARDLNLVVRFVPNLKARGTYRDGLIQIRAGLSQRDRRTTLAHEIVHHERGDDGAACTRWHLIKQERAVHLEASRRLLPIAEIAAVQFEPDPASALWVDEYTLALRMRHLTTAERAMLAGDEWMTA